MELITSIPAAPDKSTRLSSFRCGASCEYALADNSSVTADNAAKMLSLMSFPLPWCRQQLNAALLRRNRIVAVRKGRKNLLVADGPHSREGSGIAHTGDQPADIRIRTARGNLIKGGENPPALIVRQAHAAGLNAFGVDLPQRFFQRTSVIDDAEIAFFPKRDLLRQIAVQRCQCTLCARDRIRAHVLCVVAQ